MDEYTVDCRGISQKKPTDQRIYDHVQGKPAELFCYYILFVYCLFITNWFGKVVLHNLEKSDTGKHSLAVYC